MPQYSEDLNLNFIDTGAVNWKPIKDNFTNLHADMKANAEEITALAKRQTNTISMLFETDGKHVIMAAKKHLRVKCINAFAQLGDSIKSPVKCNFNGDSLSFTDTEGAGKARAFRLGASSSFHFIDEIYIEQTGARKVIYTLTFESEEEQ